MKNPRVNVTVTEEQHQLLLEIARLQGGSASGILRQHLDAATPLLRAALPMLRRAAEEAEISRAEAAELLSVPLQAMADAVAQADLIASDIIVGRSGPRAAIGRERARTGTARG